jgi:uncharacterized protein (TIGR03435 family)
MRTESGELLAVGISSNKSRGFESGLGGRRGRTFSPRPSAAGLIASTLVLAGLTLAGSLSPRWIAFAQEQPRLAFEAATVKPNNSGETRVSGGFRLGGRYTVTNYTLRSLIAAAYVRPQVNPDFLIAGGPKWIDSDRFDVDAKAADEFPMGEDGPVAPRRLMLQALLEDRFKLKVHHETRQGPVFALLFARNDRAPGPKLRRSSIDCAAPPAGTRGCTARIGQGRIAAAGTTVAQFASLLPRFVDRVVIDSTGLMGRYDLELKWTPAPGEWAAPPPPGRGESPPADGPSLFTALQEQLGVKLQSQTGPIDTLVIDQVEKPDAN